MIWCDASEAMTEYKIRQTENLETSHYDGVLVCVAHDDFKQMGIVKIKSFCRNEHVIFDLKNVFSVIKQTSVSKEYFYEKFCTNWRSGIRRS